MQIHVVQQQDQYGVWDITGHAFANEARCRAAVRKMEANFILEHLGMFSDYETLLAELLPDLDFDEYEYEVEELVTAILARDRDEVHEFVEEKIRTGGAFSWETVDVEDLPNP